MGVWDKTRLKDLVHTFTLGITRLCAHGTLRYHDFDISNIMDFVNEPTMSWVACYEIEQEQTAIQEGIYRVAMMRARFAKRACLISSGSM